MERPAKVSLNGVTVEGVSVDFTPVVEAWSEYKLADGTIIKSRPVAIDFVRIPGQFDVNGQPAFVAQIQNVMSVSAPDKLRKQDVIAPAKPRLDWKRDNANDRSGTLLF